MNIDLNILNNKSKINIDDKINFPKEDLKKAGILDLKEVNIKGEITVDFDEYLLNLNVKGEMVLPCSLTLEPVDYPFDIKIEENLNEIIKKTQKTPRKEIKLAKLRRQDYIERCKNNEDIKWIF